MAEQLQVQIPMNQTPAFVSQGNSRNVSICCPLCKRQPPLLFDDRATFDVHLHQQHGDRIVEQKQEGAEIDAQVWSDELAAQGAKAAGEAVAAQRAKSAQAPQPVLKR